MTSQQTTTWGSVDYQKAIKFFSSNDHFGNLLGYKILSPKSPDSGPTCEMVISQKHLSPAGVCHGGALSSLADVLMGTVAIASVPIMYAVSTIEFKINYLKPVKLGDVVKGYAKVVSLGRSHVVVEGRLKVNGEDVVISTGTYNVYRPKNFLTPKL